MKPVAEFWRKREGNHPPARSHGKGKVIVYSLIFLMASLCPLLFWPAHADTSLPSPSKDGIVREDGGGSRKDLHHPSGREDGKSRGSKKELSSPGFPVETHSSVFRHLQLYQTTNREHLLLGFRKAETYLALVKAVFEMVGLPADLSNLAFLESNYNPFAYSRAGAAGIWQLMESTARLFGLEINWWVDERRDPEKSTRAAATYLKQLYKIFGSWPLAIAAYNAGEVKVLKALRGSAKTDVWSLPLPRETWGLVSGFMAVTLIVKDPEVYYFPPLEEDSPNYVKVPVDSCTDIRVIALACDVPPEQIRSLNPELNQGCTPPDQEHYEVRIPMEARYRFWENFSAIPPEKRITWACHTVQRGDTLPRIATRYRVPASLIARMNQLSSAHPLPAGKDLLLPIPEGFRSGAAQKSSLRRAEMAPTSRDSSSAIHVVQEGDNLSRIARDHGLSLKTLRDANGLEGTTLIRPGDRLRIPLSATD